MENISFKNYQIRKNNPIRIRKIRQMVDLFLEFLKILGENRCYGFYEDFEEGGKLVEQSFPNFVSWEFFPTFLFLCSTLLL